MLLTKKIKTPSGVSYSLYNDIISQNHCLIAGTTGSGKSNVINGIICELMLKKFNYMVFIDLKRVELSRYKKLRQCYAIATEKADAIRILKKSIDIMNNRYKEMQRKRQTITDRNDIYIIIDELAELIDGNKKVKELLKTLLRLGRAAKIHVIGATQSPNRQTIPADLTLNFTARVGLRCLNSIESRQVLNGFNGCENLPQFGQCLYFKPGYQYPELHQIPLTDENEIKKLVKHWKRLL